MGVAEVMVALLLAAPGALNLNAPNVPVALNPALNFQISVPRPAMWRAPWLSQTGPRKYPTSSRSGGHGGFHRGGGGGACPGGRR